MWINLVISQNLLLLNSTNMESQAEMVYNSQKDLLIMPEYGRNIQLMIREVKKIEDKELRQAHAEEVVELMNRMNPRNKQMEDYIDKLWKHFFHIAEYEIEVDTPSGETPTLDTNLLKPDRVPYPHHKMRFRHYGFNIQRMIDSALLMEDGPVKDGYFRVIGSYMKLAYKTWNKEHYVSDEIIKEDLASLTGGKFRIDEDTALDVLANPTVKRRNKRPNGHQNNNYRNNNRRNGGYRNNRNNNNRNRRY